MTSACLICGGATRRKLSVNSGPWSAEAKDYEIVRCATCHFEFVDPIPSTDELLGQYDTDDFFEYSLFRNEIDLDDPAKTLPAPVIAANDDMLDYAEARLGRKGSFCDVGCGEGKVVWWAAHRGWDAAGIEPSEYAAKMAVSELEIDVRRGVLEDGLFDGRRFDVVSLSHVLEHLPDPMDALKRLRDLVADDGFLHIEIPNLNSLARYYARDEWRHYVPPRHLVYFSNKTLRAALTQSGFAVTDSYARVMRPPFWKRGRSFKDVEMVPAEQTGLRDNASLKQRAKATMRVPLERMRLLDNLHVWATPA